MPDKEKRKYVLAVHGGAETVKRSDVTRKKEEEYRKGIEAALQEGTKILERGGSAVDAVEAAVACMEDNPIFNAGRGGNLNVHGEVCADAAIMDGRNMNAGSAGAIRFVKNPVKLAKCIMLKCEHSFLTGTGAEEFALSQKVEMEGFAYFVTEERLKLWKKDADEKLLEQHDTVGAVAMDHEGNLAAATSTGGIQNQQKGRISDSPVIGSGTFAKNGVCAVTCTGDGDAIIRGVLAHEVYAMMKYTNLSVKQAANKAIKVYDEDLGGDKGLIALDSEGKVVFAFNTNLMKRGYCAEGSEPFIALWSDEKDK